MITAGPPGLDHGGQIRRRFLRLSRWPIPRTPPVAAAATVQVAASVIVTAVLTPLLTSWWY